MECPQIKKDKNKMCFYSDRICLGVWKFIASFENGFVE